MNETKSFLGGVCGTLLSATGTALQPNEVLETISLIITIIGGLLTLIIIPILNWYKKSKQDGKIDIDEIKEGANIIKDGVDTIIDDVSKTKGEKENDIQK